MYARLQEIVGTLLLLRTPAELVQALASLHMIPGSEFIATELHRVLASRYLRGTMRFVWMEAGLHPRTIFESCIGGRYVPDDRFNDALLSEYDKFVKIYKGVHPYGINTRDA